MALQVKSINFLAHGETIFSAEIVALPNADAPTEVVEMKLNEGDLGIIRRIIEGYFGRMQAALTPYAGKGIPIKKESLDDDVPF